MKEKEDDLVLLECMVCGTTFLGEEPLYCCSGRECGCMGMPVDPIVCSKECYEMIIGRKDQVGYVEA